MNTLVEQYKETRDRWLAARARGVDADAIETQMDSLWNRMSGAERRSVLGAGGQEEKRAAA
jgi:hypothetical protein